MTSIKIVIIAAITTFICNTALEFFRNTNIRELEKQKRIWDLKAPIYMKLAEELEELFLDNDNKNIEVKDIEKRFNKICNKIFLVADDNVIKQLNSMSGGPEAKDDIGKVLIILRKELDKNTNLKFSDYKRKQLSISKPKR